MPQNGVAMMLGHRPHSEHGDGYFKDHRHGLSRREEMRALELDPHHFYKVKPEPEHHEHAYFEDFDDADGDLRSEDARYDDEQDGVDENDEYYEGLIGTQNMDDEHDIDSDNFSGSNQKIESHLSFSSDADNDILFNINDNLQFKLESEDNYQGRDVDIGIVMP